MKAMEIADNEQYKRVVKVVQYTYQHFVGSTYTEDGVC